MIGVKYFPQIPPRLEIVKVPPERSLGLRAFDLALSLTSDSSIDKSEIVFLSTSLITGTISPLGVSTATVSYTHLTLPTKRIV